MEGKMDIQQVVSMLSNLGVGGEQSGINGLVMLMDMMKNNRFLKRRRRLERDNENEERIVSDRKVIDVDIKEEEPNQRIEQMERRPRSRRKKRSLRDRRSTKMSVKKHYNE